MRRLKFDIHILVFCTAVIVLSILITPSTETLSLWGYTLPPMCAYKFLFNFECLGCGLTRSFTFMGHLDIAAAWGMNRFGPLLWLMFAVQIPYRIVRLVLRSVVKKPSSPA